MKNIRAITYGLIVCMLLTTMPISGFATETVAEVQCTVELGTGAANKPVGIKVYNPGKSDTSNVSINSSNITDVFRYVGEETADAAGTVNVSFVPGPDSVWYTIVATPESGAPSKTEKKAYISQSGFDAAVTALKGASGTGAVAGGFFKDPAETDPLKTDYLPDYIILGLDSTDAYKNVFSTGLCSSDIKTEIYKTYEKKGAELSLTSATIQADVKTLFEKSVYEEVLFNLKDEAKLKQFIKDYDEKLAIKELPVYKNVYKNTSAYSELADGMVTALASHNWTIEEKADMANTFQEILFLNAVQSATLYDTKTKIVNSSKDFLSSNGANMQGFSQVVGDEVCRLFTEAFKNKQPQKIEEFVTEFNKAVTQCAGSGTGSSSDPSFGVTPPSTPSYGGNGGGGGGGGGFPNISIGGGATQIQPPKQVKKLPFSDLENCSWAHEAISALAEDGIIDGKEEEKYCPDDKMTREEFVKLIVLAFNLFNKEAVTELQDVRVTAWYYPYVASATDSGIIQGYNSKFGIGEEISRQDMAVILQRVLKIAGKTLASESKHTEFADSANIADYAKDAVDTLARAGAINGMGDGSFAPLQAVTRAQAAKVIYEVRRKVNE